MARLDSELVARGIARSRERAKEMITSGAVTVNGRTIKKAAYDVSDSDEIASSEEEIYVGRGALKLEEAAKVFGIDFSNAVCLDIGASTGGFTEYMLMHGASKVFSVDVGHGQLAEKLCKDSRVVNMEGMDIREVTADDIGGCVDIVSVDVSFISLTKVLPKVAELLKEEGCAAVLIKPQFEAGRSDIGKNGIVKDKSVHLRVLTDIDLFTRTVGLCPVSYTCSPVKGGSGNIEYLMLLRKNVESKPVSVKMLSSVVDDAFGKL